MKEVTTIGRGHVVVATIGPEPGAEEVPWPEQEAEAGDAPELEMELRI